MHLEIGGPGAYVWRRGCVAAFRGVYGMRGHWPIHWGALVGVALGVAIWGAAALSGQPMDQTPMQTVIGSAAIGALVAWARNQATGKNRRRE